ncbi:alpha/beta hydrolase fold protein [Fonsecaea pedrosoi]|nr:alpha/beta hydrolase fold protein [Fonsecaea pedrosoi]
MPTLHNLHDYDPIIGPLAKNHRTIAIDWPWHGDSKGISKYENLSAAGLADVLEDVVEGLQLQAAVFVGNSVGGFAAARLAITHRGRVRGLILENTGGFVDWTTFSRAGVKWLGSSAFSRFAMPWLVRKYMSPQSRADEEITARVAKRAGTEEGSFVAARIWRSFLNPEHDLRSRAGDINIPVLLIWGTRDPITPTKVGEATQ